MAIYKSEKYAPGTKLEDIIKKAQARATPGGLSVPKTASGNIIKEAILQRSKQGAMSKTFGKTISSRKPVDLKGGTRTNPELPLPTTTYRSRVSKEIGIEAAKKYLTSKAGKYFLSGFRRGVKKGE